MASASSNSAASAKVRKSVIAYPRPRGRTSRFSRPQVLAGIMSGAGAVAGAVAAEAARRGPSRQSPGGHEESRIRQHVLPRPARPRPDHAQRLPQQRSVARRSRKTPARRPRRRRQKSPHQSRNRPRHHRPAPQSRKQPLPTPRPSPPAPSTNPSLRATGV